MKERHRYAKRPCSQPEILNFSKVQVCDENCIFSTLHEEAPETRLFPTAFVQGSNGSGTRQNITLTKVALRRRLSDDAWIRNLISQRPTLRARTTSSSSSSKVAKHVGGPYTGQDTVQWDSSFV